MITDKKILAIETSAELCSVSVNFEYDTYDERSILMKHIHSEKLIPIIDEVLGSNNLKTADLDIIAISNGPGSFTGLRIGMAAAKGLAYATGLPIVQVPTFNALSFEINNYLPENINYAIINNANIEECYFGKYKSKKPYPEVLEDVNLINKEQIDVKIGENYLLYGNLKAQDKIINVTSPRASSIAKWTYIFGEDLLTFEYDYLEPNYLKNFKVRSVK